MVDELAQRRTAQRRAATLSRSRVYAHLQWSPAWELELRVSGRRWFVAMTALAMLTTGAIAAGALTVLARWTLAGDGRMIALCGAAMAVALWRAIALTRRRIDRDQEHEGDPP